MPDRMGLPSKATRGAASAVIAAALYFAAGAAIAQSGGFLPSAAQLQGVEAESRAFQKHGEQGGSLLPQNTAKTCDDDGVARLGAPKKGTVFDTPDSLIDEEIGTSSPSNTTIVGTVNVICQ